MINRAKMPRQLRNKGGITNVVPREKYGLGSKIKERFRKLIPNEIANIAVKAAPFVAPFNPAIAGLMRGIGRFDQRGSLSDAFKQGLATTAFGAGARALGGATDIMGGGIRGGFTSPLSPDRTTAVQDFFKPGEKKDTDFIEKITSDTKKDVGFKSIRDATGLFKDVPILKDLPNIVQQQILVGGVSGAATYIYQAFLAEEPPQQESETYEEYMARRKENVGKKMKGYFDNYFKFDKEYSSMTDEQKQEFIDRVNVRDGGRVSYQTGGITMANTLAENIRRNLANQAAVAQQFRQARANIPGYVEPVVKPAPKAAPIKIEKPDLPISKPVQPPGGDVQPILPVMPDQPGRPGTGRPGRPDNIIERVLPMEPPTEVRRGVEPVEGGIQPGGPADDMIFRKLPVEPDPDTPIDELIMPIMPTLPVQPRRDQDILEGFAKFKEQNPELMQGTGTMAIVEGVLPGGTPITFSGGVESGAFNKYLESLGLSRSDIIKPKGINTMIEDGIGFQSRLMPSLGIGPAGPGMTDPLQLFSGLNAFQLSELPEQDFLALEKKFDALPQAEKDKLDKRINTMLDQQAEQFFADEKKFGSFADGREVDIGAGRIAYQDLLRVFQNDYPAEFAKLTGNETLAELDQKLLDLSPSMTFSPSSGGSTSGAGSNLDPVYTMSPSNVASFLKANPIYNTTRGRYYAGRNQFMKTGGRVRLEEGGTGFMKWLKANYGLEVKDLNLEEYVKLSREFNNENPDPNETGRKKNAMGSMPTGIMRTNKAGVMERDYRDKGGFVPVGIKEKADDVPAMLSKNEFVFTADAVRGAGNGSIEKGAQRMYETMKKLEKRVV